MAVMEAFCFLRFGGAFGTLGTAAIMAPSQRATAERSEEMCVAFALAALTEGGLVTMNHVPEAPQSASGDYAWLGAEPGSVADQLYMSAADEWNQAINSRFVNELLDDTLPESILKSYLI